MGDAPPSNNGPHTTAIGGKHDCYKSPLFLILLPPLPDLQQPNLKQEAPWVLPPRVPQPIKMLDLIISPIIIWASNTLSCLQAQYSPSTWGRLHWFQGESGRLCASPHWF